MPAPGKSITDALAALQNGTLPKLDVKYGDESIPQVGAKLANKTVVPQPTITTTGLDLSKNPTYLVCLIDLDAPHPSFPLASPIMHWLQPDLTTSSSSSSTATTTPTLTSTTRAIFPYHGAGPPPFSPPHRYVFLLYEQPKEGFSAEELRPAKGKEMTIWERIRWDHDAWEALAGVGGVVAGNWFVAGSV